MGKTKEIFVEILSEFYKSDHLVTLSREGTVELLPGKATVITGVRRCGKSVLASQLAEKFGFPKSKVISINFSDERLADVAALELGDLLEAYFSLNNFEPTKKDPLLLILDEIQLVKKWERFVDRILRQPQYRVILTGSSSHFLSTEIATEMRGRSLSWELFPFSFMEYLKFNNIDYKFKTPKNKVVLEKAFSQYLIQGGFPEVLISSDQIRHQILQEYFESIFYKDLIERFKIKDVFTAKALLKLLVHQIGALYSLSKLYERLKSLGFKFHKSLILEVLSGLEDAYSFFSLTLFTESEQKRLINPKKIYCVDVGLVNAMQAGVLINSGRLLENYVFMCFRKSKSVLGYYKTESGLEVDFVIRLKTKLLFVQVCESLENEETLNRELKALNQAISENPKAEGLMITRVSEKIKDCPFPLVSASELEMKIQSLL